MSQLHQALAQLKAGQWINLSHTVTPAIPHFPIFNPLEVRDLSSVQGDGYLCQEVTIGTQYGTHIDAPFHFVEGRKNLQEIDLKQKLLPLVVLHLEDKVAKNPDYQVSIQDILDYEAQYGPLPQDAFVAFASGWANRFHDPEQFYNRDDQGVDRTPGWSLEVLDFLQNERSVAAIGHETINTDSGQAIAQTGKLEAEYYWLDKNKFQIEVINNLDLVPAAGSLIKIGYPNIDGISGFTVDLVAIVPA
ncbi:TPA: cyclase family protein [Streptococcus suis]